MNRALSVRGSDVPGHGSGNAVRWYGDVVMLTARETAQRVVSVVCAAVLLVGCGAEPSSDAAVDTTVVTDTTTAAAAGSATTGVPSADDWTSPVVGGGTFSFAEARAKGPFGFWFWAPG